MLCRLRTAKIPYLAAFERTCMKLYPAKTIKEIAELLNVRFTGPENHLITGINEIHQVESGDMSFVDHPKYYDKCLNSAATTILINKEVACPPGKALLFSEDPIADYNFLVRFFRPFQAANQMIAESAQIARSSIIQPGVFIGNHVKIGEDCIIHPNVTIYDYTEIGNRVEIHAGSVIGADAFYYKRRPDGYDKLRSSGKVVIEDDVEIGAGCTIDKGVSGDTILGKGTKLDNQIHIGHDTIIGQHCLFAAQVGIAGVTKVEDEVILWGQVGVSKDLTIGKGAVVLAQSGVPKSLEGGKTYFGTPVGEARSKMKEQAYIKRIPDMLETLRINQKQSD
jgi:UDP-3-O-[3-hydroxymyristoyl] glucosamine N-acyltransferase